MCSVDFLTRSPLAQGSLCFVQFSYLSPSEGGFLCKNVTKISLYIWTYLGGLRDSGTLIIPRHISSLFILSLSHPFERELETLWEHVSVFSEGVVHLWMLTSKLYKFLFAAGMCCQVYVYGGCAAPRNGEYSYSFVWIYWNRPRCQKMPYTWELGIC